jgi:Family of unknown function (DUF6082)
MRTLIFRNQRRRLISILVTLSTLVFLAAVVLFPILAGTLFDQVSDWRELSDVGQAYGGVSAILAAFALCGIAASLLLQRRQNNLTRISYARERHFELVKIMIDRPSLRYRATDDNESDEVYTKKAMFNLWVSHWKMLWDAGIVDAEHLKWDCDGLFVDELARSWWSAVGERWADSSGEHRKFREVVSRSCAEALASAAAAEEMRLKALAAQE